MILVDVYIPALEKTYDFRLDECAPLREVCMEICEQICQKEQCSMNENREEITLWNYKKRELLSGMANLRSAGITSGCKLMLI